MPVNPTAWGSGVNAVPVICRQSVTVSHLEKRVVGFWGRRMRRLLPHDNNLFE